MAKLPSHKPVEITRSIKRPVERELWGRAAARCQFSGCNRLLYKSPVTQEKVNLAEMAHIYSFSQDGPRGWGPFKLKPKGLNDLRNLLLVCHDCHKTIDQDKTGSRYSAELLKRWKEEHEARVRIVTGILPSKKSHVVLYGARIGDARSPLQNDAAIQAMFPTWNPADERSIDLSMTSGLDDSAPEFWTAESAHLRKEFDRQIRSRVEEADPNHFSIFALAPQPLLILLGSLLTDKVPTVVYQLHREPKTWEWQPHPEGFAFKLQEPVTKSGKPVLVISLSAKIGHDRIKSVLDGELSIWELTVDDPHNDFLKSEAQLALFRQAVRKAMVAISAAHAQANALAVFPAMPVSCAVELGRARMPKADMRWAIYDQNDKHQKFIPTITIGADQ